MKLPFDLNTPECFVILTLGEKIPGSDILLTSHTARVKPNGQYMYIDVPYSSNTIIIIQKSTGLVMTATRFPVIYYLGVQISPRNIKFNLHIPAYIWAKYHYMTKEGEDKDLILLGMQLAYVEYLEKRRKTT